ncbi:MAG: riboflavin synthase [Eubacterium sp.]|nr:riboflavin synthase [Eubacterium sp.]
MFTGIIEEVGEIRTIKKGANSAVITINAKTVLEDIHLGDSIALNGVCLTVVDIGRNSYSVDVMHETLRRTNLGELKSGSKVNLERAMAADGRFGGHIVAGHVDGTGKIRSMKKDDNAIWITVDTSKEILKYIISKGSITIDGISLTVADVDDKSFSVSIIPHTGMHTTLLMKKPGDTVNLENDMVGKYVEKLLRYGEVPAEEKEEKKSGITMDFLIKNGF